MIEFIWLSSYKIDETQLYNAKVHWLIGLNLKRLVDHLILVCKYYRLC